MLRIWGMSSRAWRVMPFQWAYVSSVSDTGVAVIAASGFAVPSGTTVAAACGFGVHFTHSTALDPVVM